MSNQVVGLCTAAVLILVLGVGKLNAEAPLSDDVKLIVSEFIYEQAPFPQCHASTIEQTPSGLVAAWFGGEEEGDRTVGIWVSCHDGQQWSAPVEVANGDQTTGDVKRYPCWNPVLHQIDDGPLVLYYKVGPSPRQWWGMVIQSRDGGGTWDPPRRLPEGILGPIKNKPITLKDGTILSGSSTEHEGWRVHFEWSTDKAQTWQRTPAINDGKQFGIIQPTLFQLGNGDIVAYCRSRQRKVVETRSRDQGRTWSAPVATNLHNPNSGVDGVTLSDGGHALIYNDTPRGRTPLNLAIAADDQLHWMPAMILESEPGEYSYPAIIQTNDGHLHMTYTWKRRRVRHVEVQLTKGSGSFISEAGKAR